MIATLQAPSGATVKALMSATVCDELRETFRLTPREAHVAMLLAVRTTNREIASELGVTEHTARRHTEKVLMKLDVHRRHDVQGALLRCCRSCDWR